MPVLRSLPVQTIDEIADSTPATGADVELDDIGVPSRPAVVVDAERWTKLSQERLDQALAGLRGSRAVVIVLAGDQPLSSALTGAADIVLGSAAEVSPQVVVVGRSAPVRPTGWSSASSAIRLRRSH